MTGSQLCDCPTTGSMVGCPTLQPALIAVSSSAGWSASTPLTQQPYNPVQKRLKLRIKCTKTNLTNKALENSKADWALNIGFHLLQVLFPFLSDTLKNTCSPMLQGMLATHPRDLLKRTTLPMNLKKSLRAIGDTVDPNLHVEPAVLEDEDTVLETDDDEEDTDYPDQMPAPVRF